MSSTPGTVRIGSPAPKAYKVLGEDRLAIDVLCPEVAMTHFSFGNFRPEEADEVRVVHCPVCGRKHALMWPAAWLAGVPTGRTERRGAKAG